jgi:hypothetical protein
LKSENPEERKMTVTKTNRLPEETGSRHKLKQYMGPEGEIMIYRDCSPSLTSELRISPHSSAIGAGSRWWW